MKNWIFILLSFFPVFLFAQEDTIYIDRTLEIISNPIRTNDIASEIQEWDTEKNSLPAQNIGQLLQAETGIFIKNYGSGSLATSSARGGNASHTLVLWNDLPLQSPMLGQLDFSLLPVLSAESVQVQYGGSTANWGSGAVGGIVRLNSKANFENKFQVAARSSIGSFGHFNEQLQVKFGTNKWQSVTKISHQQAENNFTYKIREDLPERQQTDAAFSQQNIFQDFYYNINPKNRLKIHYWFQNSYREIPPTTVQNFSNAHQNDIANRLILHWNKLGNKFASNVKVGLFNEQLDYVDSLINLFSPSQFTSLIGEVDGQYYFENIGGKLYLGATQTYTTATSNGYSDENSEYRTAIFGKYSYANKRNWNAELSLRQEIVNGQILPIVPMLALSKSLNTNFQLKAKVSRNYRLPTLNDRFWEPGGNENLLPESGWSEELTLVFKGKQESIKARLSVTGFNRNMNNWIFWSIAEGQNFWSSNNITSVWSRGIESRLNFTFQIKDIRLEWNCGYYWTRSTNQIALSVPRIPAGQQLFYTPIHQANTRLSARWKGLNIAYQHQFVGATLGINENPEAYQIGNFQFNYNISKLGQRLGERPLVSLFINVYNIWNTSYYIIERRPMAGRHFEAGLSCNFAWKQKEIRKLSSIDF